MSETRKMGNSFSSLKKPHKNSLVDMTNLGDEVPIVESDTINVVGVQISSPSIRIVDVYSRWNRCTTETIHIEI